MGGADDYQLDVEVATWYVEDMAKLLMHENCKCMLMTTNRIRPRERPWKHIKCVSRRRQEQLRYVSSSLSLLLQTQNPYHAWLYERIYILTLQPSHRIGPRPQNDPSRRRQVARTQSLDDQIPCLPRRFLRVQHGYHCDERCLWLVCCREGPMNGRDGDGMCSVAWELMET